MFIVGSCDYIIKFYFFICYLSLGYVILNSFEFFIFLFNLIFFYNDDSFDIFFSNYDDYGI